MAKETKVKSNNKSESSKTSRNKVPATILNQWKIKSRHGDIERISERTPLSRGTVANAFKGLASDNTIKTINQYFKGAA